MAPTEKARVQPAENGRYEVVERVMQRFDHRPDALLEVLNTAQEAFGYLPEDVLRHVSEGLSVSLSHIYGVATFYSMLTLEPVGEVRCMLCADPACAVAGAGEVLEAACRAASLSGPGEVSADGKVSVERVTCLGLCDQAPAALVNGTAQVDLEAGRVKALLKGKAARSRLQVSGEPRIMTALIGELEPTDLPAHRAAGAFEAFEKALTGMTPEEVIEQVKLSGLAGRGGAGFPTGQKWEFTRGAAATPRYAVCNFDESEPGTFKDRTLMQGDPFRALEGLLLCGYAIGAQEGFVFVRGEYPEATAVVQAAIDALYEAGLLGQGILGTDFSFDLTIRRGAGAYICGEETALFEAIEGNRGYPRSKPPFPTTQGLFGQPTSINNVETLALVPDIVLNGGQWLKQWGTEGSVGVKLFCLSGHVKQPGVVEVPYGTPLRELVERYGGGFDGQPQAVLMGGAAGGLLHPDNLDVPLTHEALQPFGVPIGSGVVMVFNQSVDLLAVLRNLAHFFVHETCGRCVPCRVGTTQMVRLLDRIGVGDGTADDLYKLEELGSFVRQATACGLGQTAANPILTSLDAFRPLYEAHIPAAPAAKAAD